jgi:hypothetical protein
MARLQFRERNVAANLDIQVEADAAVLEQLPTAQDHMLLQLEIGNAVDQQAADAVLAVVHVDRVAELAQLLRRGQTSGPRCRTRYR